LEGSRAFSRSQAIELVIDPAQTSEATVALAERLVASCETLDEAAEELALVLLAADRLTTDRK
jgi:hypothetical protein